jgi:hypothetical protein
LIGPFAGRLVRHIGVGLQFLEKLDDQWAKIKTYPTVVLPAVAPGRGLIAALSPRRTQVRLIPLLFPCVWPSPEVLPPPRRPLQRKSTVCGLK